MNQPRISGFTIVRNAVTLDYPFRESVNSLLALCDEVVINCGDSSDGTREICEQLRQEHIDRVHVFYTQWETQDQSGGLQLRKQTDSAFAKCRGEWGVYLQADEVLHEADFPAIRSALELASRQPNIDGLVFDYLHFYGSYDYEIRGRNWYRREVRALKRNRGIEAFRDAQGFRKNGARLKAIHSGARVFHYGYVRESRSLTTKAEQMAQWWGETLDKSSRPTLQRHVGLRRYQGTHPQFMTARVQSASHDFDPKHCPRKWDWNEIKNAITLAWESIVPYRIGEFRNYDL